MSARTAIRCHTCRQWASFGLGSHTCPPRWEAISDYCDGDSWEDHAAVVYADCASEAAEACCDDDDPEGPDETRVGVRSAAGDVTTWLVYREYEVTYTAEPLEVTP